LTIRIYKAIQIFNIPLYMVVWR